MNTRADQVRPVTGGIVPAMATTPRVPTPEELRHAHLLRSDPTLWGKPEIRAALGNIDRSTMDRLMYTGLNYALKGVVQWPPDRSVIGKKDDLPVVAERSLKDWPPHHSILPAPTVWVGADRPRWRAGVIRTWAMQVGRMTLDGQPIVLGPGRGQPRLRLRATRSADDADLETLHYLIDDPAPWDLTDIQAFFQVDALTARYWMQAADNRALSGVRTWPPSFQESRTRAEPKTRGRLRRWPPHYRMLPGPGERTAGEIKLWAMQTGRMLPDGTLVNLSGKRSTRRES